MEAGMGTAFAAPRGSPGATGAASCPAAAHRRSGGRGGGLLEAGRVLRGAAPPAPGPGSAARQVLRR